MKKIFLMTCLLTLSLFAKTAVDVNTSTLVTEPVYTKTYATPASKIYKDLKLALGKAHLKVVAEVDILAKFKAAGLPEKFAKDFNTNNLTVIKAIIACNGGFGNGIANLDPMMMAYCPIRITVIEKEGKTSVLYVRPTLGTKGSKAFGMLQDLEKKVIATIDSL